MARANISTCPASMGKRSMAMARRITRAVVALSNRGRQEPEGFEVVVLEVLTTEGDGWSATRATASPNGPMCAMRRLSSSNRGPVRWYSTDSVSTTGATRSSATPVSARSLHQSERERVERGLARGVGELRDVLRREVAGAGGGRRDVDDAARVALEHVGEEPVDQRDRGQQVEVRARSSSATPGCRGTGR